jgi:hypothetical protein
LEEVNLWKDSEVPFTQSYVTRHRYQAFWRDVVELEPIKLKKVAEEM